VLRSLVAHGGKAGQFEFQLFTCKFHLQPVSRKISERLNYSSYAHAPSHLQVGTPSSLLMYRFDPVTKTACSVGASPDSSGCLWTFLPTDSRSPD
jgi:hypothetical protein